MIYVCIYIYIINKQINNVISLKKEYVMNILLQIHNKLYDICIYIIINKQINNVISLKKEY